MNYTIKTNIGDVVVNDGILSNEEYAAIKLHRDRKAALGGRLVILRESIKLSYKGSADDLEDLIDHTLKQNNYDIDQVIDHYRSIAQPEPKTDISICHCGYRKPFCVCGAKS